MKSFRNILGSKDSIIFSAKVKVLPDASDFRDYIKLLKVYTKTAALNPSFRLESDKNRILFEYFTFVDRVNAFDNVTQLIEVDRLHAELLTLNHNFYFIRARPQQFW